MAYSLWRSDEDQARDAFLAGEPAEVVESEYGLNEHLFEFLRERGWWERLTGMQPKLGKVNGKSPVALNGAWAMVNLAHLGHLEHADPLLRDGRLMTEVGFTLREVKQAQKLETGVVHRDTLRNHVKRIPLAESTRVLYESVSWMHSQKGLRGGWYAVDGFRIEVTGKQYERAGKVWDPDENRWVYGYKVVLMLNVSKGRERIVGMAMGPIQKDERQLLLQILADMQASGLEPKALIDGLIMDRGYWGAAFLDKLQTNYGLNWCTLIPASVKELHAEVARLVAQKEIKLAKRVITRRSGCKEALQVGGTSDLLAVVEEAQSLRVNVTVARRVDEKTGEVQDRLFATNVSLQKLKPYQVVTKYSERWAIENEGVRELSQRWRARIPIGRSFTAIHAQLVQLAMCYNAMKDYAMKRPKEAEALQTECRRRARRSYLAGKAVIVFIARRRIYAVMDGAALADLSRERTLRRIEYLLARGLKPQEAIDQTRREQLSGSRAV